MAPASLSPSATRFGLPSVSAAFAPVHAFMALFMSGQRQQGSFQPVIPCVTPRLSSSQSASQQAMALTVMASSVRPVSRLKIVREFEPGMARSQAGRMVISGRMSDVCAELDRIARNEISTH